MKRLISRLSLLAVFSIVLSACSLPGLGNQHAGIQITTTPQANVYLDNDPLGPQPIIRDNIKPGNHTIRIASSDSTILPYETQVTLNPGVVTIIDRQLSTDPTQVSGYTLTFEKLSDKNATEVNVITTQENVSVSIDGNPAGFTPVNTNSIAAGTHVFLLSSPGYQDKTVKANVQAGHRLVINAQLASQQTVPVPSISPEPIATPSGSITPTLKPSDLSPTPKSSTSSAAVAKPYVEILSTPTGWLRVRAEGDPNATEVAKVYPGDKLPYLDSNTAGWYEIEYQTGKNGWISSQYAKLVK